MSGKKNSCEPKILHPPHHFSYGPSLSTIEACAKKERLQILPKDPQKALQVQRKNTKNTDWHSDREDDNVLMRWIYLLTTFQKKKGVF